MTSAFSGHGLDGDFTFPVGVYNMTRDMYWRTGILQDGSVIATNGFVPHFQISLIGPITGTAIIHRNGHDAGINGVPGAGHAVGSGTLGGGSGSGAVGTITVGQEADAFGFWPASFRPGLGGAGGDGLFAPGDGGAAGGGPASIVSEADGSMDVIAALRMTIAFNAVSGGAGGSSGSGPGSAFGGGGGGGAGNVVVCTNEFLNAENVIVEARGGAGGAGSGAHAGGGGGGGGGMIVIVAGCDPFPRTDNSGGRGGASGGGSGKSGSAGSPGAPAMLFIG